MPSVKHPKDVREEAKRLYAIHDSYSRFEVFFENYADESAKLRKIQIFPDVRSPHKEFYVVLNVEGDLYVSYGKVVLKQARLIGYLIEERNLELPCVIYPYEKVLDAENNTKYQSLW